MTTKTRYFVIVSLLVLTVGLGTGLVAYYVGIPGSPFSRAAGPGELQFVPRDATVVAYANVREVMASDVRQRVRKYAPSENGQQEFRNETGIDIESDIDRVVACLEGGAPNPKGMVLARGRFNETKIEGLAREHGAEIQDYKGKRLIMVTPATMARQHAEESGEPTATPEPRHDTSFALAFVEPGLVAVGSADLVRQAIDGTGEKVTSNSELMGLVKSLDSGNAWAVGRFDALRANAHLPEGIAAQIPAITWFSVTSQIDGGIRGVLRAETRDEESANNLRDVARGFMALAKLQAGSKPELQTMIQALQLGGTGKTVALSFDIPAQVFDALGEAAGQAHPKPRLRPRGE